MMQGFFVVVVGVLPDYTFILKAGKEAEANSDMREDLKLCVCVVIHFRSVGCGGCFDFS